MYDPPPGAPGGSIRLYDARLACFSIDHRTTPPSYATSTLSMSLGEIWTARAIGLDPIDPTVFESQRGLGAKGREAANVRSPPRRDIHARPPQPILLLRPHVRNPRRSQMSVPLEIQERRRAVLHRQDHLPIPCSVRQDPSCARSSNQKRGGDVRETWSERCRHP